MEEEADAIGPKTAAPPVPELEIAPDFPDTPEMPEDDFWDIPDLPVGHFLRPQEPESRPEVPEEPAALSDEPETVIEPESPEPPAPKADCPVVIVGAGPTGLAAAIDLWLRGIRDVVILEHGEALSQGVKAFSWSRRSLEILTRLGVGSKVVAAGATSRARTLSWGSREIFRQELRPDPGYGHPASVSLGQAELQAILGERLAELEHPGPRFSHRLVGIEDHGETIGLSIETPDGPLHIETSWLIAADGVDSTARDLLGLIPIASAPAEAVLLASIRTNPPAANLQQSWLRPDFADDVAASIQPLPGGLHRVEFLLGPGLDPREEGQISRIAPRIAALLGRDTGFELLRFGHYIARPGRLARFVHGRVIFAGDAAHVVSALGGRGANEGLSDIDNLCWKLALVLQDKTGADILDSYDFERKEAIDHRFVHAARATTLMAPAAGMGRHFRDAALDLAASHPFARALIDIAAPPSIAVATASPLSGPDELGEPRQARPGAPCPDAPIRLDDGEIGQLLDRLGDGFVLLHFAQRGGDPPAMRETLAKWKRAKVPMTLLSVGDGANRLADVFGLAASRLAGAPGALLLIRPDKRVAARFARFDAAAIERALLRAFGPSPRIIVEESAEAKTPEAKRLGYRTGGIRISGMKAEILR